jgi:hypothetical protein
LRFVRFAACFVGGGITGSQCTQQSLNEYLAGPEWVSRNKTTLNQSSGANQYLAIMSCWKISNGDNRWDEKADLRRDALSSQVIDAL